MRSQGKKNGRQTSSLDQLEYLITGTKPKPKNVRNLAAERYQRGLAAFRRMK